MHFGTSSPQLSPSEKWKAYTFQSVAGTGVDDLVAQLVGGADLRAAGLACVVEGVLVHLGGDRVVDDVNRSTPL